MLRVNPDQNETLTLYKFELRFSKVIFAHMRFFIFRFPAFDAHKVGVSQGRLLGRGHLVSTRDSKNAAAPLPKSLARALPERCSMI
jgi:hypothetical protein